MATHVPRPGTFAGIALVGIFLGLLAWLPGRLRPREVVLPLTPEGGARAEKIALDTELPAALLPPAIASRVPAGNWLGQSKPGPRVKLEDLFGGKRSLIVNFWASWCPPCLDELPSLEMLHRQLASLPQGPRVVTITVDVTLAPVEQLLRTLSFSYSMPTLHDADGLLAQRIGTTRFPETYWFDRDGSILHKWVGPQAWLSSDVIEKIAKK